MNIDLSGLKDIHLPIEPSILPLAWGWWVSLLAFILVLIGIYWLIIFVRESRQRYILHRLAEIKNISNDDFLKEITFFTKQVAIALYGREKVASLYGQSWIDFLNKHGSVYFSKDFVELLEKNMYALQKSLTDSQKEKIFKLYEAWIKENLKRKGKE